MVSLYYGKIVLNTANIMGFFDIPLEIKYFKHM